MNIERQSVQHRYEIVGRSPVVLEAVDKLIQVAPTDLTVLITGESGTGKEVFAKALHGLSRRRHQPLVSVNCGAIPATLLEAELFGHERGAFTGAVERRLGFFEVANRGTIFLDEIGEMTFDTQVKLLRVLESGEFSRVGSSEVQRVDVRVIAATNRRLEEELQRGTFRQDLFYRLNTVRIELPPLHKHPEDVPLLVEYFARKTAAKLGVAYEGVSPEALQLLVSLPWLGNIRELKNMVETVVTLERGKTITLAVLRPYIPLALKAPETTATSDEYSLVRVVEPTVHQPDIPELYDMLLDIRREVEFIKALLLDRAHPLIGEGEKPDIAEKPVSEQLLEDAQSLRLDVVERQLIIRVLQLHKGNRRKAAEELGISPRTLYRKLKEYHLLDSL